MNPKYRGTNEEKRNKLREIEMKTMEYQDELESGGREVKPGWTIPQQVEHYRRKLLKRVSHPSISKEFKIISHLLISLPSIRLKPFSTFTSGCTTIAHFNFSAIELQLQKLVCFVFLLLPISLHE